MSAVLLAEHIRRAAHGNHRCGWCDEPIEADHVYRDQRIADDGRAYTWREHLRCAAFVWSHLDQFERDEVYDPRRTYAELVDEYGSPH